MNEGLSQIDALFTFARKVVITAHAHPDGDALGSCAAMRSYLKDVRRVDATIILPDSAGSSLDFIFSDDDKATTVYASKNRERALDLIEEADTLIMLDGNGFYRAEGIGDELDASTATKVLIDHHLGPMSDNFDIVFSYPESSSTAEVLFGVLMAMPDIRGNAHRLPLHCAEALMTGLTTDTNNFTNSTTPATLRMASDLLEAGVDRDAILSKLYERGREARVRLMGYLESANMVITDEGMAYIILTKKMQDKFGMEEGDTEGLVNIPLSIDRVRMSVFLKEENDYFRVSIRSKKGISAQECAATYFDGGGHENAAGGKMHFPDGHPSEKAAKELLDRISKEFFG